MKFYNKHDYQERYVKVYEKIKNLIQKYPEESKDLDGLLKELEKLNDKIQEDNRLNLYLEQKLRSNYQEKYIRLIDEIAGIIDVCNDPDSDYHKSFKFLIRDLRNIEY